jgi:hypothetical protein
MVRALLMFKHRSLQQPMVQMKMFMIICVRYSDMWFNLNSIPALGCRGVIVKQ